MIPLRSPPKSGCRAHDRMLLLKQNIGPNFSHVEPPSRSFGNKQLIKKKNLAYTCVLSGLLYSPKLKSVVLQTKLTTSVVQPDANIDDVEGTNRRRLPRRILDINAYS